MNFVSLKSGTSVEGTEIVAFRSDKKENSYCYLMAGVHGDEVEGVYVLNELYQWLQQDTEIKDISFIVIPILNVDGYRAGNRTNAHGVDLNRNLPSKNWESEVREAKYNPGPKPLSEPENQFLDQLFAKYPPHLILTFHSWKPILNYNSDCRDVAEFVAQHNNYPVEGDIGYPTPGSLGNYAPEKYQSPVLTYECPTLSDKMDLKSIWEENEKGLKLLLQSPLIKAKK
jgi:murein peptide amidase A